MGQEDCELETSQLYIAKLTQKKNGYLGSQFIWVHDVGDFSQNGLTSFLKIGHNIKARAWGPGSKGREDVPVPFKVTPLVI